MEMYSNFIDFKKAFDRAWHDALWAVLEKHAIDSGIMRGVFETFRGRITKEVEHCVKLMMSMHATVYRKR